VNRACVGCTVIPAAVRVPAEALGREGEPVPMCWLCAHLVVAHDVPIAGLASARPCGCNPATIYPQPMTAGMRRGTAGVIHCGEPRGTDDEPTLVIRRAPADAQEVR